MGDLGDHRTLPILLNGLRDENPHIVDQTEKVQSNHLSSTIMKWQLVWAWSLCHYYLGYQSMFVVLKLMSGLFCEGNVENLHALWDGRGWSSTTGIEHHPHFVTFVTIFDPIKKSIFPRCAAATLSLNKCFPWSGGGQLKALTTWTWLIWCAGFLFSFMHVGDNCNIYCEVMELLCRRGLHNWSQGMDTGKRRVSSLRSSLKPAH
jgi:hypothetical protein